MNMRQRPRRHSWASLAGVAALAAACGKAPTPASPAAEPAAPPPPGATLEASDSPARAAAPKERPASELSGNLQLGVEQNGPELPWQLRIDNGLGYDVQVVADPRLLWFEVKPPDGKAAVCRLPESLFPRLPSRRARVRLRPGESVRYRFDPRLYCFDPQGQRLLVPGALVTAHFGWPPAKPKSAWRDGRRVELTPEPAPPFVAHPVAGSEAAPAPTESTPQSPALPDPSRSFKQLEAAPFALRSEYRQWAREGLRGDDVASDDQPFSLSISSGSDANSGRDTTLQVAIANRSSDRRFLYFRRELLTLEVRGPDGQFSCNPAPDVREPDPSQYLSFAPQQRMTFTSRLPELCPRGSFDRPGLYLVHARFDSVGRSAGPGTRTFRGTVVTHQPGLVRVLRKDEPFALRRRMHKVPARGTESRP